MALGTIGLTTHIWNNNLKSMIILGLYPLIVIGLLWAITAAVGGILASTAAVQNGTVDVLGQAISFGNQTTSEIWPIVMGVVAVWFCISWFFHGKMIGALSNSHGVTRKDEPHLYNMLENLCISKGLSMPSLEIVESHALNAFASGLSEGSYKITLTRGLLQTLDKEEVEAVMAHELTHIINRDVRLLMVCIIFTGMLGFAVQLVWMQMRHSLFYGGRKRDGRILLIAIAILAILGIGYLTTIASRFALSRKREYMADAGAVELTRNPSAMMRALQKISGHSVMVKSSADVAMMCIENPVPFMGLFATHPPIEKRIETLSEVSGEPVPSDTGGDSVETQHEDGVNWVDRAEDVASRRNKIGNPWARK